MIRKRSMKYNVLQVYTVILSDPELEALQAEYKRSKSKSKDQAKNEPDEAQSSLRSLAEKNVAKGASENPPPPPLPPPPPPSAVLEENPRKRKGRPPKMVVLQEQLELEGYPSWLPSGWVILRNTRVNGRSAGHVDKYFIELSTRNQCRSKKDVLQYTSKQQNEQAYAMLRIPAHFTELHHTYFTFLEIFRNSLFFAFAARRMKEIRAMAVKAFPAMSKPKCAVVVDCIQWR
ncbi:hypothetical protein TEA_011234 [Camellia sinensis var. sinensis]|uniref:Uncharacterized protein n=1 Tax=Camellia sinensis var. sinensis TaxID=542762 RepID=A0A4S4DQC7_CAMSN|nr:hypothetical protein TEA_011234 [Camellia sinensis var. sinensis]